MYMSRMAYLPAPSYRRPTRAAPPTPVRVNSNSTLEAVQSDRDIFTPVQAAQDLPEEMTFGSEYKVKQYGSNVLISGGAIAAGVFIFAPEPFVTKLIGGGIALACIAAGGTSKHFMYRKAYVHRALEKSIGRLQGQIQTLGTEIAILEATSKNLDQVNTGLAKTAKVFKKQISNLKGEVDRLESEVAEAFEQLNKDRTSFEEEKSAKIAQLNDELEEADARGDNLITKIEVLEIRQAALDTLADELDVRRQKVVGSEAELRRMQNQLLGLLSDNPQLVEHLPLPVAVSSSTHSSVQTEEPAVPTIPTVTRIFGTNEETLLQNLKTLSTLPEIRGAKLRVADDGSFKIQKSGFFSQSVPRSFHDGESVTNRRNFFHPVFRFFHNGKTTFLDCEMQQAFNGLSSLRRTYRTEAKKLKALNKVIEAVLADNPDLEIPKR